MLLQYRHDKAISKEIDSLTIICSNCETWTGQYRHFQVSSRIFISAMYDYWNLQITNFSGLAF